MRGSYSSKRLVDGHIPIRPNLSFSKIPEPGNAQGKFVVAGIPSPNNSSRETRMSPAAEPASGAGKIDCRSCKCKLTEQRKGKRTQVTITTYICSAWLPGSISHKRCLESSVDEFLPYDKQNQLGRLGGASYPHIPLSAIKHGRCFWPSRLYHDRLESHSLWPDKYIRRFSRILIRCCETGKGY